MRLSFLYTAHKYTRPNSCNTQKTFFEFWMLEYIYPSIHLNGSAKVDYFYRILWACIPVLFTWKNEYSCRERKVLSL